MKRNPFRKARNSHSRKLGWLTLVTALSYILAGTFFPKETIQFVESLKLLAS